MAKKKKVPKLKGTRLAYNAAVQARYRNAIQTLIKQMTTETKAQVKRLFNGEIADDYFDQQEEAAAMDASIASKAKKLMSKLSAKFSQLFNAKSSVLAKSMVAQTTKSSEASLKMSLKKLSGGMSLKTGVVPKGMEDISQATIAENVSLIKTIPTQYLNDVTGSVMRSISKGAGIADLIPEITKYGMITERRGRMIAYDQTRKAYNSINKVRLQSNGVKQFEWAHSGGGHTPRQSHIKISGHIFSFENLIKEQADLGVPEKDRGLPGYPINCGCTMIPVVNFGEE